jgi:ankyrin repeat-rich membrane spanning protein
MVVRDANPCPVPQANVNGRVLSQCNLDELKKEMEMNFGDWQLFRGMVRPVT